MHDDDDAAGLRSMASLGKVGESMRCSSFFFLLLSFSNVYLHGAGEMGNSFELLLVGALTAELCARGMEFSFSWK